MSKNKQQYDFASNGFDNWMKQTQAFFESADVNLKGLFTTGSPINPQDHMQVIQEWMQTLKHQWEAMAIKQKTHENYWKMMSAMSMEAADLMLKQWIQRSKENKPVKDMRELYELWLNSCHEVYTKAMHSTDWQNVYGEMMNESLQYWKEFLPK